jgi:hypothetical protein
MHITERDYNSNLVDNKFLKIGIRRIAIWPEESAASVELRSLSSGIHIK